MMNFIQGVVMSWTAIFNGEDEPLSLKQQI
jgi:hypothetical protein